MNPKRSRKTSLTMVSVDQGRAGAVSAIAEGTFTMPWLEQWFGGLWPRLREWLIGRDGFHAVRDRDERCRKERCFRTRWNASLPCWAVTLWNRSAGHGGVDVRAAESQGWVARWGGWIAGGGSWAVDCAFHDVRCASGTARGVIEVVRGRLCRAGRTFSRAGGRFCIVGGMLLDVEWLSDGA